MDCSLPGSSVHGILQARILEWVAIPFSKEPSQPRDWTWVSCIAGRFFTIWATENGKCNYYKCNWLGYNYQFWNLNYVEYISLCIYMYIYVYICICIYMYICICVCICMCMYMYIYMCIYISLCIIYHTLDHKTVRLPCLILYVVPVSIMDLTEWLIFLNHDNLFILMKANFRM